MTSKTRTSQSNVAWPHRRGLSEIFRRRRFCLLLCVPLAFIFSACSQTNTLFKQDFDKIEIGQVPDGFLVLDGGFAVKEESGNRFLELPGAPLDSFGAQFGPTEVSDIAVVARIKSTAKGRRFPTFGIGLNGVAGYKLQVSPAKSALELYKDQTLKDKVPFDWKSGQWTHLRLQVRKAKENTWKIEAKAWAQDTPEPARWLVEFEESEPPIRGRPSLFGSPFSGTPIAFDDLAVTPAVP